MRKRNRGTLLKSCLVAGMLALAACGGDTGTDTGAEATDEPLATTATAAAATGSVDASDQTGDGKTLKVDSVTIDGSDGFIAVHTDANGAPGPVVGHAAVKEGTTTNLVVPLDTPQQTGMYWPMLHVDKGTTGTYEFPGADVPVTEGGTPVMKQVTLTVSG